MLLQDILEPGKLLLVWLFKYTYTSNNAACYTFISTLAPSSSSAQQSSFHSLFGGPSPTAGLTSCSGRGVWVRENRQNRQNRAWTSGWTCFPVFQHGSTHPPPQHHFGGGSPLQTLTSPWHQQWEPAGTLECLHAEGWRLDDPASLQDIN